MGLFFGSKVGWAVSSSKTLFSAIHQPSSSMYGSSLYMLLLCSIIFVLTNNLIFCVKAFPCTNLIISFWSWSLSKFLILINSSVSPLYLVWHHEHQFVNEVFFFWTSEPNLWPFLSFPSLRCFQNLPPYHFESPQHLYGTYFLGHQFPKN